MINYSKEVDQLVGKNIKAARLAAGLSQQDLGCELNVTYKQISRYENGTNRISAGALYVLAQKLKKSVNFFFK